MTISKIKMTIDAPVACVWQIVTSLENYTWRSDISKLEVINDKQFVEISQEGISTYFTITVTKPYQQWAFDIENDNMTGHWVGNFTDHETYTAVEFIETITAKKILMKPFIKMYLKKQQALYCHDLKQAAEDKNPSVRKKPL